jgi:hypothetical protein
VPAGEDDRRPVEPGHEQPALVVGREAHGPDEPVAVALQHPRRGGVDERAGGLLVVLALEPAEEPPPVALELPEVAIDVGGDPPHDAAVPLGQEVLRLGVLEERVAPAVELLADEQAQRRDPVRLVPVQAVRQVDEGPQVASSAHRPDAQCHGLDPTHGRIGSAACAGSGRPRRPPGAAGVGGSRAREGVAV